MSRKTSTLSELNRRLDKDPEHQKEYHRQTPYHDLLLDIIRRRKELEITQQELADLSGMHQSQVSRIENAEHDPRLSTIIKLAEALGMRVDMRLVPVAQIGAAEWEAMITIPAEAGRKTVEYSVTAERRTRVEIPRWNQ